MKLCRFAVVGAAAFALSAGAANSATVVDTGGVSSGATTTGYGVNKEQWLAGEFTTFADFTVTDVEGWIGTSSKNPSVGSLFARIYSDGGDNPGSLLYSADFTTSGSIPGQWQGAHGLAWNLEAGTYWVSFGSTTYSGASYLSQTTGTPLANEAFAQPVYGEDPSRWHDWRPHDGLDLAIRITGNPGLNNPTVTSPVPEPEQWAMLMAGFAGIGLVTRTRSRSTARGGTL